MRRLNSSANWLRRTARGAGLVAAALVALTSLDAQAVPSYARQTGQDCAACHIGAFGPQLTPYGMRFKLGGYTDSDGKDGKIPLSGMVVASATHNATADDNGKKNHSSLDEASIFLAGRLTDHIGSFVQVTRDGVEHSTALDQADLRFTTTADVAGKDTIFGLSLNNNPSLTDPFNTLPAWSFPYISSPKSAGTGGADFVGFGWLEQKVWGLSGYTLWNNSVYGELGTYRALSPSALSRLGIGKDSAVGELSGSSYWRLGYTRDMKSRAWSVGLIGSNGTLKDRVSGDETAKFHDIGVDGSYQFLGTREHVMTLNASYIKERDSVADDTQKELKLNGSYYYQNTYGGSLGYFQNKSKSGTKDNRGYILQADWTPWGKENSWAAPWANLRLGVQYVGFTKFTDENGPAAKPSDNNSLNIFAWTSF